MLDRIELPAIYALYRRNNYNQPCVWKVSAIYELEHSFKIEYGIVNKKIKTEIIKTHRCVHDEIDSKIKEKRKQGYKFLNEIKDNNELPVEGTLYEFLDKYLPINRTTSDGTLLPMLAKVYDNNNNKLFKNTKWYFGQAKINGLRCIITPYYTNNLLIPIGLKFQSREGTYWNSLSNLEDYLLHAIEEKVLIEMIENHYSLDGELYLPGHSVNEINHFVKDSKCKENKQLEYWCYDVIMEDASFDTRLDWLDYNFINFVISCLDTENHYNYKNRFKLLYTRMITSGDEAIRYRDIYINAGFEGLIMRNPNNEYQFGKRNLSMIKYKKSTDGVFTIIDIYPEGIKRNYIPLILCKNDINDSTFECHIGGSFEYQEYVLKHKQEFIGKQLCIEYGERSGVNQLPFHIKSVVLKQ